MNWLINEWIPPRVDELEQLAAFSGRHLCHRLKSVTPRSTGSMTSQKLAVLEPSP